MSDSGAAPVLVVDDLHVAYRTATGAVDAVRGVDLFVRPGEVVALVGESGSGKTTVAQSVIGLLATGGTVTQGATVFDGRDITGWTDRKLQEIRGVGIGFVPQDPSVSLNPVKRIGAQVAEVLRIHGMANRRQAWVEAVEILRRAGLSEPEARARQYPYQLSGGMRQRVLIGIAMACKPKLLIADEPTSALDVTVQRRVLDHLQEVTAEHGTAVLFITHDLGVASDRSDRIYVMRAGQLVESGATADVLDRPQAAYTRRLLAAAPSLTTAPLPTPARTRPAGAAGAVVPISGAAPIVEVRHLTKHFRLPVPGERTHVLRAVDDVSFAVANGTTFGLVGESGSGKSTTARLIMRLERATSGEILFAGDDITRARGRAMRRVRRRVQVVYQNPYSSLSPRLTIEQIITEPLRAFAIGNGATQRTRAAALLDQVSLPAALLGRKPTELSGGQRQRVAIARALAIEPDLVVLDEPVSALDVSVQSQILALLAELRAELGVSFLLISHDLAVVRQIAADVAVMRAGKIVEQGPVEQIFAAPRDEYTKELLASIPGRRHRSGPRVNVS